MQILSFVVRDFFVTISYDMKLITTDVNIMVLRSNLPLILCNMVSSELENLSQGLDID